jgi:TP901 family phage tail tape measure protein
MAQGKVGSLYFTLGVNASDFEKKLNTATAKIADFGKNAERVGRSLSMSLTLPLSLLGGAAAKTAMDFETSMAKIVGLVGITTEEVDSMKESVLALAGETGKAPQDLADALFVITSAGLRGADAMNALEYSAKASTAGLGQTADIARSVAGSMNAYGASVIDAAKATDIIVATARAGNFETSQFAEAIGRVLPYAKQAGASMEELGGAVALLTRTNGDAAQSITQVSALFRSFVVPSEEAKKKLNELGVSANHFREIISEQGLPAALQELERLLDGNREMMGFILGSSEAASAAFQILEADNKTLADTFGVVGNSVGMTQEAFDAMAQTAEFKLDVALTKAKVGLIALGNAVMVSLTPTIEKLTEMIGELTEWYTSLDADTQQMIVRFGMLAAAIGPVLLIVGQLISLLPVLTAGFVALNTVLMSNPFVAAAAAALTLYYGYKKLFTTTKELNNEMKGAMIVAGNYASAIDELGKAIGEVNKAKTSGKKINEEELAILKLTTQSRLNEARATLKQLDAQRELINVEVARLEFMRKTGQLSDKAFADVSNAIVGYLKQLDKLDTQQAVITKQIDDLAESFDNLDDNVQVIGKIDKSWKLAGKTVGEIESRITELGDALKGMVPHSKEFNATMAEISRLKLIIDTSGVVENKKDFQELNEVVDLSAGKMAAFQASINSLSKTDNLTPFLNTITDEFKRLDEIAKALGTKSEDLAGQKLSVIENQIIAMIDAGKAGTQEFQELLEMYNEFKGLAELEESLESIKWSAETLMPVFGALGQAIGGSLQGAAAGWAQFGANVASGISILIDAAKAAVAAHKAKAIAAAIAGGSEAGAATGPLAPFTTPAFIATLLGVVGGAIAAIPKFATGGAVTGPTLALVGENPASRGEAIIPFERMGSFLQQFGMGGSGNQHITISGQLAGDTIRLSGQSASNKIASVRWGR